MHEHSLQAVSMRGVIVYASSFEARKSVPSIADLGLYLDPVWETADLPSVYEILECPYRDWETDRKSTRLNSSHSAKSRMPSSA